MTERLGLFSFTGNGYALPLSRLVRVLETGHVYPLPLVPQGVEGMLIHGSELVPLLGCRWLTRDVMPVVAGIQVVVASEYGTMALPADKSQGIVTESRGNRQPVTESESDFWVDNFFYQGGSYRVVNIDALAASLIRP